MKRLIIIVISVLLLIVPAKAQWDTTRSTTHYTLPLATGTTLIATGAAFTFISPLKSVAVNLRDAVQADGHQKLHFDDYIQYLPAATSVTLNLFGVKSRHNLKKMALLEGSSYLLGFLIVESSKRLTRVERPDGRSLTSFPSGHTFTSTVGAEILRREYGKEYPWIAVAGYAIAATVAGMRIYNNRHWLGDVTAGAGVAILSTSLIYWLFD